MNHSVERSVEKMPRVSQHRATEIFNSYESTNRVLAMKRQTYYFIIV